MHRNPWVFLKHGLDFVTTLLNCFSESLLSKEENLEFSLVAFKALQILVSA